MAKIFLLLVSLILFIFVVVGSFGSEHVASLEGRLQVLRIDSGVLEEKNRFLQTKIDGLSGPNISYDLLEEQARGVLHYSGPGDILLNELEVLP